MSEANIKTVVKVEIADAHIDEWNIEGYGDTLLKAIYNAFQSNEEYVTQISISDVAVSLVDMVEVDGRKFFEQCERDYTEEDMAKFELLDPPRQSQKKHTKMAKDLLKVSPIFKKYIDEEKERQAKENAKIAAEEELIERKQLDILLAKYGAKK